MKLELFVRYMPDLVKLHEDDGAEDEDDGHDEEEDGAQVDPFLVPAIVNENSK